MTVESSQEGRGGGEDAALRDGSSASQEQSIPDRSRLTFFQATSKRKTSPCIGYSRMEGSKGKDRPVYEKQCRWRWREERGRQSKPNK